MKNLWIYKMKFCNVGLIAAGLTLGVGLAVPANASNTNGYGYITNVSGTYNGALLFNVDLSFYSMETKTRRATATRDTPPACAAGQPNRWAIDASTVAGQAAVQTLLWAMEHRRRISVTGSGKCSIWPDTETVSAFNMHDD